MADNTNVENLRKLLAFLKNHIINKPENAWFVDELHKTIGISATLIAGLDKVEKYLGLDYRLDDAKTIIDYDFIENDHIRHCFQSDCREMLRYRYGTRGHKPDFSEFCRYVIMQAERLLNIYYSTKGSFEEIKTYIKKYNEGAKFADEIKSIEAISFAVKLWAYTTEYNLSGIKKTLDRVREVRNSQSHGDIALKDEDELFFEEYKNLISYNFPLLPNGWVNWNLLNENLVLKNIYTTQFKNKPNHNKYIFIAWKRSLPFVEVIDALEILATHIKSSLSKYENI